MWATRLGAAIVVLMIAGLTWAALTGGGWSTFGTMMREPLYLVTLLDLYAGCALVAAWVWVRHRSIPTVVGWSLVFLVTGNIGTGAYVVIAAVQSRGDLRSFMLGRSGDADPSVAA